MAKCILLLSASPKYPEQKDSNREFRGIIDVLQRGKCRDSIKHEQLGAIRISDVQQYLLDYEPHLIHFSGLGSEQGLCFENDDGLPQPVLINAFADLLGLFSKFIQCVSLNTCNSIQHAKIIAEQIPYVIGISGDVDHKITATFFVGFYRALASGNTIEEAFEQGKVSIELEGFNGKNQFELIHIIEESSANTFIDRKSALSSNLLSIEVNAAFDQNRKLTDALSKGIEQEFIRNKSLYQQGSCQHAVDNIENLHKDENWSIFDILLKKDILSTLAIYHLNQSKNIAEAEKLLEEAHQLDGSLILADAVLAYQKNEPSQAIAICLKLNTVKEIHFKAAIEIEDNQLDTALITLASIDDSSTNAQTFLLKAYVFLLQQKLDEAYAAITHAIELEPQWASVKEIHAIILFWKSCAPAALNNISNPLSPMPFSPALLRQSDEALQNRNSATTIFRDLFKQTDSDSRNKTQLCNWLIISLLLTESTQEAQSIFTESIENKTLSVWNITWFQALEINFDREKVKAFCSSIPTDNLRYPDFRGTFYSLLLDQNNTQYVLSMLADDYPFFVQHKREDSWHFWKAQALLESDNTDQAKNEFNKINNQQNRTIALRSLNVKKVFQADDIQNVAKLISDDCSALELFDICRSHAQQGKWAFIEPLIERLITQLPTPEVVSLIANTYWNIRNPEKCLSFLDDQQAIFKNQILPPHLERLKSLCQQHLGHINPALQSARTQYQKERTAIALIDLLHVQCQYGDIEGVLSSAQKIFAFDDLINNEVLDVVEIIKAHDIDLAKLLWKKAITLPSDKSGISSNCFFLGLELGLTKEAEKFQPNMNELLAQGKALSFMDISELNSFINEEKEYCNNQYGLYTQGDIPVHLVPEAALNSAIVLFYGSIIGENDFSPLGQAAILARHGARPLKHQRTELTGRLLIDVTSLLIADRIGLLNTVTSEFPSIFFANNINQLLFFEIDKLKASQPQLVEKIKKLINWIKLGLEEEKYHLLAAANSTKHDIKTPIHAELYSILASSGAVEDLAWVDDRKISSYPRMNNCPIGSTIEILVLLRNRNALTKEQYFRHLINLRKINYRFIPLDEEEIIYWLGKSHIHKSQLVETKELKILRQYWAACLEQGSCLRVTVQTPSIRTLKIK